MNELTALIESYADKQAAIRIATSVIFAYLGQLRSGQAVRPAGNPGNT